MDFDIPIQLSINNCLTNILILLGMTYFSSFIHSPEGNDWIRYQHLLTEAHFPRNTSGERSLSESTIALSNARSHELVQRVTDNEIMALMNKPHWIVTLARTLDSIPFPISIHGLESSQLGECRYPLLYGNYAYLELTGYSNQILAGSDITFLLKSNDTNDTSNTKTPIPSLILNSFQTGTKLRLHQINYRANGELFHNFMTLLPLYNMENICKFMIIVHCDVIKKRNNPQYLHKINLFTETMLPGNIYCDEKDSSFLFSYFYNHDIFTDSH